jgi:hypothetical protein
MGAALPTDQRAGSTGQQRRALARHQNIVGVVTAKLNALRIDEALPPALVGCISAWTT